MPWIFILIVFISLPNNSIQLKKLKLEPQVCQCPTLSGADGGAVNFRYFHNCYFSIKRSGDLFNAREECEKNNAQLVMFRTIEEIDAVVPNLRCYTVCPFLCGGKPCDPCNETLCQNPASTNYWTNTFGGKYLRADMNKVTIPNKINERLFPDHDHHESTMIGSSGNFFDYSPAYRAKPLCKVDCLQRSNANKLKPEEILVLQKAMTELNDAGWSLDLESVVDSYKDALKHNRFLYDLNSNVFLQWGRIFVKNFEVLLQRKMDLPMGVPYWDWLSLELPEFVINKTFSYTGSPTYRNLFRGIPDTFGFYGKDFVYRSPTLNQRLSDLKCSMWSELRLALSMHDYCNFLQQYSTVLSRIFMLIGEDKEFSISNVQYAVYDPMFILIMANADRHFALWRKIRLWEGRDPRIKVCQKKDKINIELTPFHRSLTSSLIRENAKPKVLDSYSQLFYKYDTNDISIYAKKLNKECKCHETKSCLWIKIVFFKLPQCSIEVIISINIRDPNHHGKAKTIFEESICIKNHLETGRQKMFKVCKDVSLLLSKNPHFYERTKPDVRFKFSKKCPEGTKKPRYMISYVEGEEMP